MTDDRIVLPLGQLVLSANTLCALICPAFTGPHDEDCLLPFLIRREELLTGTYVGKVSPDCDSRKCAACTGCLHDCHRHSRRAA